MVYCRFSLLVLGLAIVFPKRGFVMVTMTVSITRTKKVAPQLLVHQHSLNVLILDSVYKKRTSVTVYWIVMMGVMNLVVVSYEQY